ncbi:hypothetical protein [Gloeobacter morelensis]|uniref:hypothetical protein n=1 Tax=Gloeobacter morelensis TaxID=2907343 RepID=UPI001E570A5E|nr:hypothetical protein [Gloeobacter morelensis]UFP97213.1 hypothetical protein ISF26_24130 [Gloeobacter morelensis MG652769]
MNKIIFAVLVFFVGFGSFAYAQLPSPIEGEICSQAIWEVELSTTVPAPAPAPWIEVHETATSFEVAVFGTAIFSRSITP